MLHSICHQIWKTQQWPQDWKRSLFIPIPNKGNSKECLDYHTIALISHASKVIHKILQTRLQQYVNQELSDVQAGFRKGRGTRDQIAISGGSSFILSSFTFIKRLLNSSLLSAIRVVSSAYLRLFIFLLAILILA